VVVTTGDPSEPTVITSFGIRGASTTSSYDEERRAMSAALRWLLDTGGTGPDTVELRRSLSARRGHTDLVWVPGHVGLPGNEAADQEAKRAATLEGVPPAAVSYGAARAAIGRRFRDPPPSHARTAEAYRDFSRSRERALNLGRSDACLLARLRAGHVRQLADYGVLLGSTASPVCRLCGGSAETVEHIFTECPTTERRRRDAFGLENTLAVLSREPQRAVALARWVLDRLGA
jgi:ribonuclease HI